MLADFLASIVNLGKKANQVEFHTHPQLPATVFVRNGDQLATHAAPPTYRKHDLAGFADLVAALKDKEMAGSPEVYVGADKVVAYLSRTDRREVVSVQLIESKRLKLCAALQAQPVKFQPKDAVKMLRLDFHGGQHDHITQALSRVDFTRTSAGHTNVAHGRESLGKSVEAVVQQAQDVPQKFNLSVPMWTTSGFTRYGVTVEFGVFLDLEGQTVELRVLSDEVERVRNLALAAVVKDLQDALEGVPVFLGTP